MTHQRHEEAKRERRRAARDEQVAERLRIYSASVPVPASHHIEQLHAHEEAVRAVLSTSCEPWACAWRRDFIEGHAIRAIVAALRELLSIDATLCESCQAPAVGRSLDDVPLCQACGDGLDARHPETCDCPNCLWGLARNGGRPRINPPRKAQR